MALDEKKYRELAQATLDRIVDAFDAIDVEDADLETAGGVINVKFRNGSRCVVNMQAPTQQLWLAGAGRGWHFAYDEGTATWLDDRGTGDEILAVLSKLTHDATGITLKFGA